MWIAIFGTILLLGIFSIFYLVSRFHRFSVLQRLAQTHKRLSWCAAALPVAAIGCFYFINLTTMFVVLLHLMFLWMLCDLIAWIIRKAAKKQRTHSYEGAAAILLTTVILSIGWYNAHHVRTTYQTFETEKTLGEPKVA